MISGPDRVDQPRGFDAPPRERGGGWEISQDWAAPVARKTPRAWQKGKKRKRNENERAAVWCAVVVVYGVVSLGGPCPPHSSLGPGGLFLASHGAPASGRWGKLIPQC